MRRTHDIVLGEGVFRLVLTPEQRVVAALDLPSSALGPLHVALNVDASPALPPQIAQTLSEAPHALVSPMVSDAVTQAAEETFEKASDAAPAIAQPAAQITQAAASHAANVILASTHIPPELHSAAHVLLRARLGDVDARGFLHRVAHAARAGIHDARHVGDALLDASTFVARAVDVPVLIANHVPGADGVVRALSPLEHYRNVITKIQHGDFQGLEHMLKSDLGMAQGIISLIPGVGTGVSAAIGAGLAALESGHPIEIAIKMAYGAIPIPPGVREVTDSVLDAILQFVENPHHLTDVALQTVRDRVPTGLPRTVFDSLVHVLVKHVPIQKEAGALVAHAVEQVAPGIVGQIGSTLSPMLAHVGLDPALAQGALSQLGPVGHLAAGLLPRGAA